MLTHVEKSRTNVYLNKVKKEQAKAIFKEYGMGLSDAINLFLTQAVAFRGIPFEIRLPNTETIQVIEKANAGIDMVETTFEAHVKEVEKCTIR